VATKRREGENKKVMSRLSRVHAREQGARQTVSGGETLNGKIKHSPATFADVQVGAPPKEKGGAEWVFREIVLP